MRLIGKLFIGSLVAEYDGGGIQENLVILLVGNAGNGLLQRWLILSEEELPLVDAETLGIDFAGIETSDKVATVGVYSINGAQLRKTNSTEGLAKGIYIVGGKKVVVR